MGWGDGIVGFSGILRENGNLRAHPAGTLPAVLGTMLTLLLLALALPAVASAAECTNTWTGPTEGSWATAANWSAEHVPTESDVACIGAGKTVTVTSGSQQAAVVQGEGALKIEKSSLELLSTSEASQIKTLTMRFEANLKGAATLNVTGSLEWALQSTMSGSGTTVLGKEATGSITTGGGHAKVTERTFVNEGSLTVNGGLLRLSEGTVFENEGTLTANLEEGSAKPAIAATEGKTEPTLINSGTLRKTSGTGSSYVQIDFENEGAVNAETGTLVFEGEGLAVTLDTETTIQGEVHFSGVSVVTGTIEVAGVITLESSLLAVPWDASAAFDHLIIKAGNTIIGEGDLYILKTLEWTHESTMAGAGTTVLGKEATGSITTGGGKAKVFERTFVNEGDLSVNGGLLQLSEAAVFDNTGSLTVNDEGPSIVISVGTGETRPLLINHGTLQKTSGTGHSHINVDVFNDGTIDASTGTLEFEGGTRLVVLASGSNLKGNIEFEEGLVVAESFTSSATVTVDGAVLEVPKGQSVTLAKFTMRYESVVAGDGTLNVSEEFHWDLQSTMTGNGTTKLLGGSVSTVAVGAGTATVDRPFINEGTLTMTDASRMKIEKGQRPENKGTFRLNAEPEYSFISLIKGEGHFLNTGTFERTEGTTTARVETPFENLGVIKEVSSSIEFDDPLKVKSSEQFGVHACQGDPVDCATGNFSESQTDLAIGGRGVGLAVTRSYSAQAAAEAASAGRFGYGWTSSFEDSLAIEEEGAEVTVVKGNGNTIPFTRVSGTTYEGPTWSQDTLSGSPETGYLFTPASQVRLGFSGAGRLEGIADRNGNETTLSYDEGGRLEAITDPAERQIVFAYDEGGQVESAEDPMGHVVEYAYEGGDLASVTLPGEEEPRWRFEYDASHRMTKMIDGRGGETTNEYDESDRVVSQTDPAGRTLNFEYAPFHTAITNEATGSVTDEWFTSNNEPFSITRGYGTADATTETFSYDEGGRTVSRTDGNGHATTYTYNEAGDRTSAKDALGNETKWTYNETHDVISETTPRGETTTIERDESGNPETISRPAPGEETQTTSFEYDANGQIEELTDPLGRIWKYEHNSQGDLTGETNPEGDKRTLEYDEDSRPIAEVSPRGNAEGAEASEYTTSYERDPQGRVVKVTDPLGHASEYSYDANGNLESATDANGHTTTYTYNADDEPTETKKPNGDTTKTEYDGAGEVVAQIDGNGRKTEYVRDILGQPVETIDPLKRATTREYDDAGNLIAKTDPEERTTSYAYDAANRQMKVSYSEEATPDAEFTYDKDGNLVAMSDGTGESSYEYDQLGRLVEAEDGNGDVVGYAYDLANQQTGVTYPNGKAVSRAFDKAGRLKSVADWLGNTASFAYDADSNLTATTFPEGTANLDEYGYDHAGRMSTVTMKRGSEVLAALGYTRDKVGQIEGLTSEGLPGPEEESFAYDENDRLTEAGSETFAYDAADNLTEASGVEYAYDAASQLEESSEATYSYDEEGERIKTTPRQGASPVFDFSVGGEGSGAGNLSAPAAVATDSEGNVWVADTAHNRIQEFDSKGGFVRQFGAKGTGNGLLSEPHGVAIDAEGDIWVADTGNDRIQKFSPAGEYLSQFGATGAAAGQLSEPNGVAIDPEGNVWVADTGNDRIQEFDSAGKFIRQVGSKGTGNGQFKEPSGIAIDPEDHVWVADTVNHRVQKFSSTGAYLSKFGKNGIANGQFKFPAGLTVDPEGDIWVADTGNDRIQKFNAKGEYLSQFGAGGGDSGQFSAPEGVALDPEGNVWVADTANDRVQEFAASEFVLEFGGEGSGPGQLSSPGETATDSEDNVWVADTGHDRIQEFDSEGNFIRQFGGSGEGDGQLSEPGGIAIDAEDHVWVADTGNHRVQEFSPEGEFLSKFGAVGSTEGKFRFLQGLAFDSEGHIWVLDENPYIARVQEFNAGGEFLSTFGSKGTGDGQFEAPQGIAIDSEDRIWVADTGNNRLQEFNTEGELIRKVGTEGAENGQFSAPAGVTVDSEDNVWVADTANNRIQQLDPEGGYLSQFGTAGNDDGQLAGPEGLSIDAEGNFWVADTANDRVQEFAASEFVRQFGGEGTGAGNLSAPAGVAADSEGNVWVADTAHNRIQEFDSKGDFVRQFGAKGIGTGEFDEPRGIAVDPEGNVWIADTGNSRVQKFDSEGEFLLAFGEKGTSSGNFWELQNLAIDSEGHLWTIEATGRVQEFSSAGSYIDKFTKAGTDPQGIAIDSEGGIWVADTGNDRIQEFDAEGELLANFGSEGAGNGQFDAPQGIAIDSEDHIWVADTANNRVQKFSSEGEYLTQFATAGNNDGQVSEPEGIATDEEGKPWIADTGNDRIDSWLLTTPPTSYTYDQAGNLTSVQRSGQGLGIDETYAYDGNGLSVSQTVSGTTSHLTWDNTAELPLLLDDGQRSYIYGPGGLPVEQISEGAPTYLHHDQLGSTRVLTNSGGKAVGTYGYGAYGEPGGSTGAQTTPLGYAGQHTNEQSGLQYLRARVYDPGVGQFLTRDPIESLTGQPYSYAADNPLRYVDRAGLEREEELPCPWCPPPAPPPEAWKEGAEELAQPFVDFWGWIRGRDSTATKELTLSEEYEEDHGCSGPLIPPGYDPDTWEKGPRSGERSGESFWDPDGGEWHWHPRDRHHPKGHWDYNPWKKWNEEWENVPHNY
jgi:RHS repeat-associated protein